MKITISKYKILIFIIIALSIIMKIIFVSKADIGLFQYDMGLYNYLDSEEKYDSVYSNFDKAPMEYSHINYIMYLYTYNNLPSVDKIIGQFYHPPLHHFIMSTWLKVMDIFSNVSSIKLESMQFVTIFYSLVILIALYKILKELKIDEKYRIIPIILFCFFPLYTYLSGCINNDELVSMFCILSFLYLIKWRKEQSYKNAILVALWIGLGLMTKTSAVVMIIPAVYVYLNKLQEYVKQEKSIKKLIVQLIIFSIIVLILGGWFHILNSFQTVTIYPPKEEMRVTTDSIWDRFGLTNIIESNKYNVWNYLLYSSVSFKIFSDKNMIIKELVVLFAILILDILYYSIKYFKENILINITNFAWILFYIYLQVSLPYECSMHARYMLVPISLGIITLGKGMQKEKNKIIKYQIIITVISLAFLGIKLILGKWGS